jgi:aminopeptidase N
MKRFVNSLKFILCSVLLSSCGIMGIHFNVHNPKKPGKYPVFDAQTILLGELTPVRQNFDVTFYDLDIQISPTEKKIGGWVEVRAVALNTIDSIQLDLDQPLSIDELRWGSREGESLTYTRLYRAVFIRLPHQLQKGQSFSINIKYNGSPVIAKKPPWVGGLVWKKDKQGKPWIGVACESEGASIWFPCKDHTSDEPDSAHMRFTIPDAGLTVVSNGVMTGTEKRNNFQSFCWNVHYPINLYDITFYIGNFEKIEDTYTGISSKELRITHYVLKPNVEKAARHFQKVKDYIKVYEEIYGEYPWYKDGFKLIEAPYAGMEHQTAIAYGNGYKNDLYGKDDYIMLHETGHEWFGNAVTVADFADIWLQEGITTYGEILYLEKKYGLKEALDHLDFYRCFIKNKRPVAGPYGRRYFDYHDGDAYVKGAWILHTLRNCINNDSLFFSIIKTFYAENKLKVTDSKAFIETVNRITGKNYSWFFDQYLNENKVPFFEFQTFNDGIIYYRWADVSDGFDKWPVLITFTGSNRNYELFPDVRVQKLTTEGQKYEEGITIHNNKGLFGVRRNKFLEYLYVPLKKQ